MSGRGPCGGLPWGRRGRRGCRSCCIHAAVDPGFTEEERQTVVELMAKGNYGHIILSTKDVDETFDRIQATGTDVVQEPTTHPWGVRDCAFRDPAGNLVRINDQG